MENLINQMLKEYIEKNILPNYEKNDKGHGLEHFYYVANRSLKFVKRLPGINLDMVYTVAAYHDVGHHIDAKNHEKISALMLENDENLKEFFSDEEVKVMAEAVYEHRASLET